MIDLTIQEAFGANATQDANYLIIQKANLPGLSKMNVNRPESLLVSLFLLLIILMAGDLLDQDNHQIVDNTNLELSYNNTGVYRKLQIYLWKGYILGEKRVNILVVSMFFSSSYQPNHSPVSDDFNY